MSRRRILVMDDDAMFRKLVSSFLQDDFDVAVAADGAAGYQQALEHVPAAAIIDLAMREWNGLRTLEAFRAHPRLQKVPVMMLTACAERQIVIQAINAGAHEYCVKSDFSRERLFEKLNRMLPPASSPTRERVAIAGGDGTPDKSARVDGPRELAGAHPSSIEPPAPASGRSAVDLQSLKDDWD